MASEQQASRWQAWQAWCAEYGGFLASEDAAMLASVAKVVSMEQEPASNPYPVDAMTLGLSMMTHMLPCSSNPYALAAALAYPLVHMAAWSDTKMADVFDARVVRLLKGLLHMEAMSRQTHLKQHYAANADNVRKMLLAMLDDIHVILLKLAERLVELENIKDFEPMQREAIADEVALVYAPLANRLGLGEMKWRLEDFAFRYTHEEDYRRISRDLNMRRVVRDALIARCQTELEAMIQAEGVARYQVSGRSKHIYSIYKKIMRKRVHFSEIYDASAMRVLLPDEEACYAVLSLVHARWKSIPQEFDDYIAHPKPNGYQSIHTAVYGPDDCIVEIQLRTFAMHEHAEGGVASHWVYKEGKPDQSYEQKINALRALMAWQRDVAEEDQGASASMASLFKDRIYVFTPEGDVLDLPAGATPLDFAYHVHTGVGHRCRGAKVNGVIQPLTVKLKTGDRISIMTSKHPKPSRDWLNASLGYLKSARARHKVAAYFNADAKAAHKLAGLAAWELLQKKEGLKRSDVPRLAKLLGFKDADALLIALGSGRLGPETLLHRWQRLEGNVPSEEASLSDLKTGGEEDDASLGRVEADDAVLRYLARCCKPIPGDAVMGFVTRGKGIAVHRADCLNVQAALARHPERAMAVSWDALVSHQAPVALSVRAKDRHALLHDVSHAIVSEAVPVLAMHTRLHASQAEATMHFTLKIKDAAQLSTLMARLKRIPGVVDVVRV